MRLSSAVLVLLGIPLLMATSLPDQPQAASGIAATKTDVPGLRMTVRNTFARMTSEQTTYIQTDRKRIEYRNSAGSPRRDGSVDLRFGPRLAAITRCDLGQSFELNLDANEYVASAYPPSALTLSKAEIEARQQRAPQAAAAGNATLRIETTTVDTGERKQFFGHTARHVITTSLTIPLEGSKTTPQERVTDGWYIDLDTRISCDPKWLEGTRIHTYLTAGLEKTEFMTHGKPETGFPADVKLTSTQTIVAPDGTAKKHTFISQTLVTSLEQRPLDAALFAVPGEFRQVESIERNPPQDLAAQVGRAWEQFKAKVGRLFE